MGQQMLKKEREQYREEQRESLIYKEKFLERRIEQAKEYAAKIASGLGDSEQDIEITYRMFLSEHYSLPIFDEYFEKRTFDQLAFEVYLIKRRKEPVLENVAETISQNLKEAADAASTGWDDVDVSDAELERMSKFMETGEFEGQQPAGDTNEDQ